MSRVDLHVHSSASDGRLSPRDLVYLAAERGVSVMALADHDTVDGLVPALTTAALFPGLTLIPAIEISTDVPSDEVHILGYFIEYTRPDLLVRLEKMRNSRLERAKKMVAKLKDMGVELDWEHVRRFAGSSTIGRPHIAQAMLEKGYIGSMSEAFNKYIGRNAPAYVSRDKLTPAEAVKLVLDVKGIPVLAHPLSIHDLEPILSALKDAGLAGMEVYYKDYGPDSRASLKQLADKNRLIATGGSDFHGLEDSDVMLGSAHVPCSAAEQLLALAGSRALESTPKRS